MKRINLHRDIDSRNSISGYKFVNEPLPVVEEKQEERVEDETAEINEEVQTDKSTKKSGKRKAAGIEEASEV